MPVDGKDAKSFVKAIKRLLSSLGVHQDSAVALAELGRLADRAAAAGENAYTLGRLQSTVEADAADEQERFPENWDRASRKKLRRWTSRHN